MSDTAVLSAGTPNCMLCPITPGLRGSGKPLLSCFLWTCLGCSLGSDPKSARGVCFFGLVGEGLTSHGM